MIERIPFGSTGHASTRVLFGAAALGGMRQERADAVLEQIVAAGVNTSTPPRATATRSSAWRRS